MSCQRRRGFPFIRSGYYENRGLIEGKTDEKVKTNNYKDYYERVLERIEIIKEANEVGFTLAEIKRLLESWYCKHAKKEDQLKLFRARIQEVDAKNKAAQAGKEKIEPGSRSN